MKLILFILGLFLSLSIGYASQSKELATIETNHPNSEKFETVANSSYNAPHGNQGPIKNMIKPFSILIQYIAPQHGLSHLARWLANSKITWLKNYLIRDFLKRYDVNMKEAIVENPLDYESFNSFFTRKLKPELRPIAPDPKQIASPVDGYVSQIGKIENETLLQAKGFYFNLASLLGSEQLAKLFSNGSFATLYLSPKDYHRVHMPMGGKLRETIFIPGKLFSVSPKTVNFVPNLFARNQRLVCIFDTDLGPMAIILVGAMVVGSIETVWHANTNGHVILRESHNESPSLSKGAELGLFKLGSTVIVLFAKDKVTWADLQENSSLRMGQSIGHSVVTK